MGEPIIVYGRYSAVLVVLEELEKLGIEIPAKEASSDVTKEDEKYCMEDLLTAVEKAKPKPKTWEQVLTLVKGVSGVAPTSVTITAAHR